METVQQNGRFTLFPLNSSLYILFSKGASLGLDEDSPYTNSCLFTLDRLPLLLLLRKN